MIKLLKCSKIICMKLLNLIMNLYQFIIRFLLKAKEISFCKDNSPFVDLTPSENADPDGSYTKALSFGFENPRIKNIALTGPYGSGKSSIIRTYEKNSKYKFLNISLASFKDEEEKSDDISLIERSILQQMLYGADANKLPYSRFKRISTPVKPLLKSILLVLWVISSILLYQFRNQIINISNFSFWHGLYLFLFAFVFVFSVVLISKMYKASFGVSLKKISIKNAEIETNDVPENSILNRHLDEIIYFFQVTDYNVVVIEDLDRFKNPEIFVKLREINKLINDNDKTQDSIKFLYALKDDMFVHKDRTKFFDFIIPVVPIINSSNSLDKIQERLKDHDFAKSINKQFLREVSLFIDDLRLIHNIFNEFVIYYERLNSQSLDVTKLLAMIIYKNVYPNDFENLHHGKGALFEICKKKSDYLIEYKKQLKEQFEKLRALVESSENEKTRSIRELIDLYIGHIVMQASQPVIGIVCNNNNVSFSQFTTFKIFEPILSEKNIHLATNSQNHPSYRVAINKSFSQIEEEINPGETFLSRKANIENRAAPKKIELEQKIKEVEDRIAGLSQIQLSQLLQSDVVKFDDLIDKGDIIDGSLLSYLVRNGNLDDNYHLYISNFHEGRLTKNDRDYLLTIRGFNQPEPNQKIDTPDEVCANMREEDFGYKYILNVTLVDNLLSNRELKFKRLESAMLYISQNYKLSEEFLAAYFITGKNLEVFIRSLSQKWSGFAVAAISSKHSAEQISYILRFVDAEYVTNNMNTKNMLTTYLSENGHFVFASDLELPGNYNVLKSLNVRFYELVLLEKNKVLIEFAHKECLYIITSANVNYILRKFATLQNIETMDPEKANYTSIVDCGSDYLKNYIEENLVDYIEKVFLTLPDNTKESGATVKTLINHEIIENDLKEKIISKQENVFMTFEGIPANLWSYVLLNEKVVVTWINISEFLCIEENDKTVVTELLGRQHIVDSISMQKISKTDIEEDDRKSLSNFIFSNNEIQDSYYCQLIKCLPFEYPNFPKEVSKEKMKCLAKERTVRLTAESFSFAADDNQLIAILISNDFNKYLEDKEKYPISDDVRELLLSSEINNGNKVIISRDVSSAGAEKSKSLSCLIANVLITNEVDCSTYDDAVLVSAIINAQSTPESIQLIVKCISHWDEKKSMEIIAKLPEPFSEISSYGEPPKFSNNEINLKFARLLEKRGFVYSVIEEDDLIKINTFKSSDRSE